MAAEDRRRAVTARLLAALWLYAAAGPPAGAAAMSVTALEVEVWSALLNHGLDAATDMVVIAEQTTGDPAAIARDPATAAAVVAELEVPQDAFDDWARRNAAIDVIDRPLDLEVSYQVINEKARAELFGAVTLAAGWSAFFERYAGAPGLIRLSHVGFDPTQQHALVYVEHHCGAECGAGRLVHLSRAAAGTWTVVAAAVVWMAE